MANYEEQMEYRKAFCNVVDMFACLMQEEEDLQKLEWLSQGLGLCCKADSLVTRAMSDTKGATDIADHAAGLYGRVRAKYMPHEGWAESEGWLDILQAYAEKASGR